MVQRVWHGRAVCSGVLGSLARGARRWPTIPPACSSVRVAACRCCCAVVAIEASATAVGSVRVRRVGGRCARPRVATSPAAAARRRSRSPPGRARNKVRLGRQDPRPSSANHRPAPQPNPDLRQKKRCSRLPRLPTQGSIEASLMLTPRQCAGWPKRPPSSVGFAISCRCVAGPHAPKRGGARVDPSKHLRRDRTCCSAKVVAD